VAIEYQGQDIQETICKYCRTVAPEGAKFCSNCGKKLPKPREAMPDPDQFIIKQVDPVLTHAEAAKLLKCSEWMLSELGNQDKIPFFKIGNRRKYYTADLIEWMRNLEGPITTTD